MRKLAIVALIATLTSCGSGSTTTPTVYTPVPYNVGINLYILTKTQEDGLQILEQILPTFTPEYTLTLNTIPDLGIKNDVPIILNNVNVQDEYDGSFQERRFVTHTLGFTMKLNLYGPVDPQKLITQVNANVGNNEDFSNPNRVYVAEGSLVTNSSFRLVKLASTSEFVRG